jgi:hypothetical protein
MSKVRLVAAAVMARCALLLVGAGTRPRKTRH